MADNEIGYKDVTLLEGHYTRQEAEVDEEYLALMAERRTRKIANRVKCTYNLSVRRDGVKKGVVDKGVHYQSRRLAIEQVMKMIDAEEERPDLVKGTITGATIYRQRYWSNWDARVGSFFLDPVVSMKRDEGTVRWRDVSGHPDAAYLSDYERG